MQITAVFNSLSELEDFASLVSGQPAKTNILPMEAPAATTPVQPTAAPEVPAAPAAPAPVQQAAAPAVPTPVQQTVTPEVPAAPAAPVLPAAVPTTSTVLTAPHNYTLDELSVAAMFLMDGGRQGDLQQLLTTFGVQSLPALPKEQYGAFATQLRALGARV
jgi:hypothetical protein